MILEKIRNYFHQLFNGQTSLSFVFWFWFVFVSFCIEYLFENNYINYLYLGEIFNFKNFLIHSSILIYSIFIFLIIFRTTRNYKGNKIWSFLAKTFVMINLFFSISLYIEIHKGYFLEDYYISKDIEEFKKELPIEVDVNSSLIDIYKKDKNIFYKYSLVDVDLSLDENKKGLKKQVYESLCENKATLDLLKKDYILNYEYTNQNDEKLIEIKTTKEHCGKSIYDLEILAEVMKRENMF